MTDDERFELELAALRPRGPSAELKRRIAVRLAATLRCDNCSPSRGWWTVSLRRFRAPLPVPHRDRARAYGAALIAVALAATLLAAIVWRGGEQAVELQSNAADTSVAMPFDESAPSVWSYRSALARSSHTLDELLSRHAAQTLEHKSGGAPDLLAARFNSNMDSFLGEL